MRKQANGCVTVKKEKRGEPDHPSIYPLSPSFGVYTGEQRNVSFLLEGKGGEIEGGRGGEWRGGRELEGGGRTHNTVRREERRKVSRRHTEERIESV